MKTPMKRFGVLLLTIALVVTGTPVSNWGVTEVLAANELVQEQSEVQTGEEIVLEDTVSKDTVSDAIPEEETGEIQTSEGQSEESFEIIDNGEAEPVGDGEVTLLAHYSFRGLTSALNGGLIEDETGNGYNATLKGSGATCGRSHWYCQEALVEVGQLT